MAKWVCSVCGYVHEGDTPPAKCPQCGVPAEKFQKQEGEKVWAAEHVLGVASDAPGEVQQAGRQDDMGSRACCRRCSGR